MFSLEEIVRSRKKVLIKREVGGLGDILVHRMIFEDFKKLLPDIEITFSCPKEYHDAISDHPFIDKIVDLNTDKFICEYNTSYACNEYELKAAPFVDKNRSDIWAEHCGVKLTNHNMHITLSQEEISWGKEMLNVGQKTVLFMPVSAMSSKNLNDEQISQVVNHLESNGYFVFSLHKKPLKFRTLYDVNLRQWMSIIFNADYIISVDTAVLHCAGGMNKPLVGIFGWSDGKIVGKYYDKMVLVQKHRDEIDWCGPCHCFSSCPKTKTTKKPCMTEITPKMIIDGFEKLL